MHQGCIAACLADLVQFASLIQVINACYGTKAHGYSAKSLIMSSEMLASYCPNTYASILLLKLLQCWFTRFILHKLIMFSMALAWHCSLCQRLQFMTLILEWAQDRTWSECIASKTEPITPHAILRLRRQKILSTEGQDWGQNGWDA